MDWYWPAFIVGAAAGLIVMWIAAAPAMAGAESDREHDREEPRP